MRRFLINFGVKWHGFLERLRGSFHKRTADVFRHLSDWNLLFRLAVFGRKPTKAVGNTPHPHKFFERAPVLKSKLQITSKPTSVTIQPSDWVPYYSRFGLRWHYETVKGRGEWQDGFGEFLEYCPIPPDKMIRMASYHMKKGNAVGFALGNREVVEDEHLAGIDLVDEAMQDDDDDDDDFYPEIMEYMFVYPGGQLSNTIQQSSYSVEKITERLLRGANIEFNDKPIPTDLYTMNLTDMEADDRFEVTQPHPQGEWHVKFLPGGQCFWYARRGEDDGQDIFLSFAWDEKEKGKLNDQSN